MAYRDEQEATIAKLRAELGDTRQLLAHRNEELLALENHYHGAAPKKRRSGLAGLWVVAGALLLPPVILGVGIGFSCALHTALVYLMPNDGAWILAIFTAMISLLLGGIALVSWITKPNR